jgi:hypothetical protein
MPLFQFQQKEKLCKKEAINHPEKRRRITGIDKGRKAKGWMDA